MADTLNLRKSLGVSRASQLVAATYSGATNTTLPGNLTVQGVLSNNVSGSLLLRAYDETGVFSAVTNVTGNPLPAAFSGRPVSALQTSSINYTNTTFSGLNQGYSLRISGYVKPPATGTMTFRLTCQDGGRLFLGLGKLLNTWTFLSTPYVGTASVAMTAGVWTPITLEHSASTTTEKLLLEYSLDGTTFNTFANGTLSSQFQFMYDSAEAGPSQLGTNYVTGKAYHNDIAYFSQGLSLPNAALLTGKVSELANDIGYVTPQGTVTGTALNITGQYASVTGNLMVGTTTCQSLIVSGLGTTQLNGPTVINGASNFNGASSFNGTTTFNGPAYQPIMPRAWGYAAPNQQAYGQNVVYGAPIIANIGDPTLCAATGGNTFTAPYDGIFSWIVSWDWQNYNGGQYYATWAQDSIKGGTYQIGRFTAYYNPTHNLSYTQQMVKNQQLTFYMYSGQAGGWGVSQIYYYVQTVAYSV